MNFQELIRTCVALIFACIFGGCSSGIAYYDYGANKSKSKAYTYYAVEESSAKQNQFTESLDEEIYDNDLIYQVMKYDTDSSWDSKYCVAEIGNGKINFRPIAPRLEFKMRFHSNSSNKNKC